ncbi:hypothetical protein PTNB73_06451 [Pyrenophora teres f. teres]|uniref:Uncharacterized protein n=1 Tax=Pyrenophora teres f. teres TaxID=97479 RepID=A0A6S6W5G4_9PLEO|nr:hypothetical protein HRS9139_07214 [Pyrenophora teres f. teres]KAE8829582.1 hypothetical protein HRS9122_09397 [Pyrenophora teres f. teres]KAE8830592.1 hypothetical protein PTNB85_07179 [Pyrenophora teres f. teres]KAE8857407.1 hypothetical protein PTNB29_08474 [Pyrenophora teres f. teres]KAE8863244.1 hypothetical protein PTNB73_06451 [Pyrenophora teres f. teres]
MPSSKTPQKHRLFFIRPATRKAPKQKRSAGYNTYLCEPSWCTPHKTSQHNCATMSAITPQSYVDDGASFTKRTPHGLSKHHVAKWISSGSDTSGYTGSFIDDGADMRFRDDATPGFGTIDKRFYKQKKRQEPKPGHETIWNEHVQKAVTGDVQRNLDKMRGLGGIQVKKRHDDRGGDGKGNEGGDKKEETVTMPAPPQWGTFVIRADDGRVIIVDKDGDFDSGPPVEAVNERPKPWVKAASTVVPPSSTGISVPSSPPKQRVPGSVPKSHVKGRANGEVKIRKQKKLQLTPPPKILTSIPESEYEDGYLPATEPVGSPTNFLMTGGASGWPSRGGTYISSPAVSVSDGYEYIGPEPKGWNLRDGYRYVRPNAHGKIESSRYEYKQTSTDKTSKTVSERSWKGGQLENAWEGYKSSHAHGSERSHQRSSNGKLRDEKKGIDDGSTKSYSTYKAPTVEDAPDTASEDNAVAGWGRGCKKNSSVQSSPNTEKLNESAWNVPHPHTWAVDGKPPSEQSWDSRPKAADNPSWTGIQPSAFPHRPANSRIISPARPCSETTWDGFERLKTLSDVSVMGSEIERESQGSKNWSQRWSRPASSHKSRSSHKNSATWEADQAGWAESQASKRSQPKSCRSNEWSDSQAGSWSGQKGTADVDGGWDGNGATKYANGFDEENETYLNESWGGIPVRVGGRARARSGSPRKHVVQGWA